MDPGQPPIYNQGELGSCTANAIAAAVQFERRDQKIDDFTPSRLFIYYNERVMEGTIRQDAGAMIRDGVKSVSVVGACSESMWKYDISKFTKKPSVSCYKDGIKRKATAYRRVPRTLNDFKAAIYERNLLIFGFAVYDSFMSVETAKTGIAKVPSKNESMLGGHAVAAVGWDDSRQSFIVRNSWGIEWGLEGFFYLPYDYFLDDNLSDDFWVVTHIKS